MIDKRIQGSNPNTTIFSFLFCYKLGVSLKIYFCIKIKVPFTTVLNRNHCEMNLHLITIIFINLSENYNLYLSENYNLYLSENILIENKGYSILQAPLQVYKILMTFTLIIKSETRPMFNTVSDLKQRYNLILDTTSSIEVIRLLNMI